MREILGEMEVINTGKIISYYDDTYILGGFTLIPDLMRIIPVEGQLSGTVLPKNLKWVHVRPVDTTSWKVLPFGSN